MSQLPILLKLHYLLLFFYCKLDVGLLVAEATLGNSANSTFASSSSVKPDDRFSRCSKATISFKASFKTKKPAAFAAGFLIFKLQLRVGLLICTHIVIVIADSDSNDATD